MEVLATNKNRTHSTYKTQVRKEELQLRDRIGMVSSNSTGGFKPVLFARNLALNSDAAPNYGFARGSSASCVKHI